MVFFVQLFLQTLVYPFVFFTGSKVGRKVESGERTEQAKLLRLEELEERSEHLILHLYLL